MINKNKKAAVLITTLWIVTILSALCISVAHRSAITLKLSSYQIDKIKAYGIAKAGICRALALKKIEYGKKFSGNIDALSKPWANSPEIFKNHPFAEGFYTVSYSMPDEKEAFLYGLSDETSRLNINKATVSMLAQLITLSGVDEGEAEKIAYCIADWRDEDNAVGDNPDTEKMLGAEDEYYKALDNPYPCKNSAFEIPEELLLVKGVTPQIFYGYKDEKGNTFKGLKDFITVYTNGEVNINTASLVALSALFGGDFEDLAEKIAIYRRGRDGIIGTKDDRWFSLGTYIIERGEQGMVEVKNLSDGDWLGNTCGITTEEYNKIKELTQRPDVKIVASSNMYRAKAQGDVKKVIASIEAVYEFKSDKETPVVKFYNQE